MSNRYWNTKNGERIEPTYCSLDDKICLYPNGYCSVCPKENSASDDNTASIWNEFGKLSKEEQNEILDIMRITKRKFVDINPRLCKVCGKRLNAHQKKYCSYQCLGKAKV